MRARFALRARVRVLSGSIDWRLCPFHTQAWGRLYRAATGLPLETTPFYGYRSCEHCLLAGLVCPMTGSVALDPPDGTYLVPMA